MSTPTNLAAPRETAVQVHANAGSVFRIDKFAVPASARVEFLAKVRATHDLLGTMEGCLQNRVLEQMSGPGRYNIVTMVEWDSPASFEQARAALMVRHERDRFDPSAMFARLGIEADLANYVACEVAVRRP